MYSHSTYPSVSGVTHLANYRAARLMYILESVCNDNVNYLSSLLRRQSVMICYAINNTVQCELRVSSFPAAANKSLFSSCFCRMIMCVPGMKIKVQMTVSLTPSHLFLTVCV